MDSEKHSSHWIGRIIGAVIVASGAFALLIYWNTWDLSMPIIAGVSIVLGLLFLSFGGSIWRWLDIIDDLS